MTDVDWGKGLHNLFGWQGMACPTLSPLGSASQCCSGDSAPDVVSDGRGTCAACRRRPPSSARAPESEQVNPQILGREEMAVNNQC